MKILEIIRKPIFGICSMLVILFLFISLGACKSGNDEGITFRQIQEEKKIEVYCKGKLFTSLIYPVNIAKPVLYPIITSSGKVLTRGFPIDPRPGERIDHPHQVGFWLNYGDINGIDFWNNSEKIPEDKKSMFGHIEYQGVLDIKSSDNQGILEISTLWKSFDDKLLLSEHTKFVFSYEADTRIIDRITTLKAESGEVSFKDNKEGMIAIRVTRALELPSEKPAVFVDSHGVASEVMTLNNEGVTGNYLSSEGITGEAVWGTRAEWMKLSGIVEEEEVALVMIDHPDNVGYPTYWHARGYGLFAANPLGQAALSNGREELNFKLSAGESTTFRYRLLVHSGGTLSRESIVDFADDFKYIK